MAVEVCNKSSDKCVDFFNKRFDSFKPIIKFTSFLDYENFLLTDYQVNNSFINTIVENDRGDQIQFDGLNCGYGGEGPNSTAKVLEQIGIDKTIAERWMYLPGLSIKFPDAFNYQSETSISPKILFVHNRKSIDLDKFEINNYSQVNVATRKIFAINPQIDNFPGLLNLLNFMQPTEMEFHIGPNSKMLHSMKYFEIFDKRNFSRFDDEMIRGVNGVNLVIYGEKFDLICFISKHYIASTINCIYSYLMKKPLFEEKQLGQYIFLPLVKENSRSYNFFLKYLFHNRAQDYHATVSVARERWS